MGSCLFTVPKPPQKSSSSTSVSMALVDKENARPASSSALACNNNSASRNQGITFKQPLLDNPCSKLPLSQSYVNTQQQQFQCSIDDEVNKNNDDALYDENSNRIMAQSIDDDAPLQSTWRVYFQQKKKDDDARMQSIDWSQNYHEIISFSSVLEFWQGVNHFTVPTKLMVNRNPSVMIFRDGIQPAWEDPQNMNGGSWRISITDKAMRNEELDRMWFETLLAVIGESLTDNSRTMDCITGIILQRRSKEDRIQVWTKNFFDREAQLAIGYALKRALGITAESQITCTRHM